MNLLIAMMSQTYTEVYSAAGEEHLMEFAKSLKEYYRAPVAPLPLHAVEHLINMIAKYGHCTEKCRKRHADDIFKETSGVELLESARHRWGKHFTWPRSTLIGRMKVARRKLTTARQVGRKSGCRGVCACFACVLRATFVLRHRKHARNLVTWCRWRWNK